jgi:hypothetical protein
LAWKADIPHKFIQIHPELTVADSPQTFKTERMTHQKRHHLLQVSAKNDISFKTAEPVSTQ